MSTKIHVSLEVSDLRESVTFYERLFSRKVSKLKEDYANFRMDEPGLHLALVKAPVSSGLRKGRIQHFGLELNSDEALNQWKESVESNGLKTRTQTGVTCCYATANKFWVLDPDGYDWEFWVRLGEGSQLAEALPDVNQKEMCCMPEAACC